MLTRTAAVRVGKTYVCMIITPCLIQASVTHDPSNRPLPSRARPKVPHRPQGLLTLSKEVLDGNPPNPYPSSMTPVPKPRPGSEPVPLPERIPNKLRPTTKHRRGR